MQDLRHIYGSTAPSFVNSPTALLEAAAPDIKGTTFFHAFQSLSVFDQAEGMWLCNNKVQAEIWCTCFVLL
jgi:hypothetical protein